MKQRRWLAFSLILILALAARLCIVHFLSSDAPDDGRLYAQLARNILEQHIYAPEAAPPYTSTLIRLPGYPLFLAGVYALFGHDNNAAVRIAQALIDTATCALIGLLAYLWEPAEKLRWRTCLIALLLAACCPWTSIYVGTILTETWALFLTTATLVSASFAFRQTPLKKRLWLRWSITGLIAGLGTMFRPDGGLLALSIGLVILFNWLFSLRAARRPTAEYSFPGLFTSLLLNASAFALSFALVLLPWTWRNAQLFLVFQPVAPAYTNMPGEFVPRGYYTWVRTWIDDNRYVDPFLWSLDSQPIKADDFPPAAFASSEERERVAALLDKYNHPPPDEDAEAAPAPEQSAASEEQSSNNDEEKNSTENGDGQDQQDQDKATAVEPPQPEPIHVEMTPEIDAGFAQIARERIARAPLHYYLWLPLKRAAALWFDTHAQYWPFDGELFPLSALDEDLNQQYWLPFFAALNLSATLLALGGALRLFLDGQRKRNIEAHLWLLLSVVVIGARLAFLSSLENIEPRYTVELFPLVIVLSALAVTSLNRRLESSAADPDG